MSASGAAHSRGSLEQVGRDLLSTDAAVAGEMQKLNVRYADTDAVGGHTKSR
ncbi:hypothetical protein ACFVH0_39240 [Streptomyces sp. NPDC127117]|uniref:hypothetical protein n=1 Tax=Streptomyces sp. NPDC127117 TaxID=3345368 RepID=UPI00363298A5